MSEYEELPLFEFSKVSIKLGLTRYRTRGSTKLSNEPESSFSFCFCIGNLCFSSLLIVVLKLRSRVSADFAK